MPEAPRKFTFDTVFDQAGDVAFAPTPVKRSYSPDEVEQIRKSFANIVTYYPKLGDVDMAKMIEQDSFAPLDALKKAVAARDSQGFSAAFGKLTAACNACHEATHFGFIKIGVPTASPFSNEVFAPASK